jgi:hypothetical protein
MTNCLFGLPSENWARTGIITASASVGGLGPGQMQGDLGATSTSWQTPAGATSAHVVVDAGAAVAWGAFGLFNANLTPAATVRWRVGSDPAFATWAYDSGTPSGTVAAGYRQSLHMPPTTQTARYMRVDIADPTNPEGVLRVAQMFAGAVRRPVRNFGFESAFARVSEFPAARTRGGQVIPDFRWAERAWAISFPSLADADVWSLAQELQRSAETGGNVLFVPFPSGADVSREAVFGLLSGASPVGWPFPAPGSRRWSVTITERL